MHPVPGEGLAGAAAALRDLVLVVGEDEVLPAGVQVERLAEVLHAHRRALDVPARPAPSERRLPLRPLGLVASSSSTARSPARSPSRTCRCPPAPRPGCRPRRAARAARTPGRRRCGSRRSPPRCRCGRGPASRSMSAIISGMWSVARGMCSGRSRRSVAMSSSKARMYSDGEAGQVLPRLLRLLDDPVVHVGHVHDLADPVAEVLERAAQDVRRHEGPEVPDVRAVVDRGTARVEGHLRRRQGRQRLDLRAQGVEESELVGHFAPRINAVRSSVQPAAPAQASTAATRAESAAAAPRPPDLGQDPTHALVAELLVPRVQGLGHAVGHHGEEVAGAEVQPRPPRGPRPPGARAPGRPR